MRSDFETVGAWLSQRGLDQLSALSWERVRAAVPAVEERWGRFGTLLLLGNRGRGLWDALEAAGALNGPDPVDRWVDRVLNAVLEGPLLGTGARIQWPRTDGIVPVSALAMAARWGSPSPLGIFVHPRWGLWLALRAVVLLDSVWPERIEPVAPHPCDDCARPCLVACPVGAIRAVDPPDLRRSFEERLRPGALCGDACLARNACPLGLDVRPGAAQQAHHQRAGNDGWRRFRGDPGLPEWERKP
jgi:ferredoxin